jgi:beta-lactam-binding protein with PASTA domain
VGAILGNPLSLAAESTFPIRGGIINGVPVGPAPPPPTPTCTTGKTIPTLVGNTVAEARARWTTIGGFTGAFLPAAGPTDTDIVTAQTTSPATNPGDCAAATTSVSVSHTATPTCAATDVIVPSLIDLTLAQARTAWTNAGFTGSFTPVSGNNTQIVRSQSTSTGRTPGQCSTPTTLVTVSYGAPPASTCTAPEVLGRSDAQAQAAYSGAGFTGTYKSTGSPGGTVESQSLVGGQPYPCTSNLTVQLKN